MSRSLSTSSKPSFWRLVFIGFFSLAAGVVFNQFSPQGIRFSVLMLSLSDTSQETGWQYIDADKGFLLLNSESARFLDIRTESDYAIDHIPTAESAPFARYFQRPSNFDAPKDRLIILYDQERNSRDVRLMARHLGRRGYQVGVLKGGLDHWLYMVYPTESGGGHD